MKTVETRVYLDTSAYLAVLLGEDEADLIQRETQNKILCSSTLLLIEAERNLVQLVRERKLEQETYGKALERLLQDVESFQLRELTADLCLTQEFPPTRTPRSSDLAHLRTARWFQQNGGLSRFLSLDKSQIAAAREFRLPT